MDVNDDGDDRDESLPVCLPTEKKNPYEQIKSMIVFSHGLSPIPDVTFRCLHVQCRVQPKNGISDFCIQHYRIVFQWVELGWYRVKPLAQKRTVLNEVFRGFLHSLQKNIQLAYLKSGHARFLPHTFQFVFHSSSYHRRCAIGANCSIVKCIAAMWKLPFTSLRRFNIIDKKAVEAYPQVRGVRQI